jgi:hypothetical protein
VYSRISKMTGLLILIYKTEKQQQQNEQKGEGSSATIRLEMYKYIWCKSKRWQTNPPCVRV